MLKNSKTKINKTTDSSFSAAPIQLRNVITSLARYLKTTLEPAEVELPGVPGEAVEHLPYPDMGLGVGVAGSTIAITADRSAHIIVHKTAVLVS